MSLAWNCGHKFSSFNGQGHTKNLGLQSTFVWEHKGEQLRWIQGPSRSKKSGDGTSPNLKKLSTPIYTSPSNLHHRCSKRRANHLQVLAATFTSDGQERFRNKELHKRHFEYHHGGKMRPARPTPVDNLDVIMFQVKISMSNSVHFKPEQLVMVEIRLHRVSSNEGIWSYCGHFELHKRLNFGHWTKIFLI